MEDVRSGLGVWVSSETSENNVKRSVRYWQIWAYYGYTSQARKRSPRNSLCG